MGVVVLEGGLVWKAPQTRRRLWLWLRRVQKKWIFYLIAPNLYFLILSITFYSSLIYSVWLCHLWSTRNMWKFNTAGKIISCSSPLSPTFNWALKAWAIFRWLFHGLMDKKKNWNRETEPKYLKTKPDLNAQIHGSFLCFYIQNTRIEPDPNGYSNI